MTTGIADLSGVRAKLRRAKEHHDTLITEWNVWCKQQANLSFCYIRRDGPWYIVMAQPFPQPDIRFSIITGDIIHNIRCALDHLIWQLVLRDSHEPGRWNEFPICDSPERFRDEVKFRQSKKNPGALYGIAVDGDAWAIIESAQPYPGRIPLLTAVRRLSNLDKHRGVYCHIPFPIPDAISQAIAWSPDAILLEHISSLRITPLSVEQETEVVRYRFADQPDPKVHMKGNFHVTPSFGEGQIKGGLQVTMMAFGHLISTVTKIVNHVGRLPRVIDG